MIGDAHGHFSRPVGFHNPLVWVCLVLSCVLEAALGHHTPLSCSCSLCHQDTKPPRNLNYWVRQDFYHQAWLGCSLALGQAATSTWENLLWVILGVFSSFTWLWAVRWEWISLPCADLILRWQNWSLGRRKCQESNFSWGCNEWCSCALCGAGVSSLQRCLLLLLAWPDPCRPAPCLSGCQLTPEPLPAGIDWNNLMLACIRWDP